MLKSQAISCIEMISETEFAEVSRTSIQTQTEHLTWKPCENALTSSESNELKIQRINYELMQVEQHMNELRSHAHCFQKTDTRQQNEIFNSEMLKCEHIKLELELQKKQLLSLKGHKDQLDLLQSESINVSEEDKKLMSTQYSKESTECILEKEQNKLLANAQQFSGALEKIIPELEKLHFKLQKLNEADAPFSIYGQNQPSERDNSYFRNCHGKPHEKESVPYSYDIRKKMLDQKDTNIAEPTDSGIKRTKCCLKHVHEEKKISMEIKQEKTKAERELQKSLCRKDRNKFNYEKAKCTTNRAEAALSLYYQYFNQTQEALHLREGTCQQFSDTIVKKGYEMLKEQCYRSQQLAVQLDKELAVHYEEAMAAHNVLEILEKHALNYSERQELLHSKEFYLEDKMILLHELIEYVERDDQRLSYFLREVNESKKKMAAMVKAVDNIEGQARSLKISDSEKVKAELMKVVKQMHYAKCLDSCRALKHSEHILSCMTEKISVKPSQLDQLRLQGEVESVLKKCQDWSRREKTLYIEQLKELEEITASQHNFSEEQSVGTVKDVYKNALDTPEKAERKEAENMSVREIKDHSGNEQTAVNPVSDANSKSLNGEAHALESAV